jgi:uncharacterized membrane-anchored protein
MATNKRNKRGNAIVDTALIVAILFVLALVWIIGSYVQGQLNTELQASDDINADGKAIMQQTTDSAYKVLDGAILFMLIIFWILAIVSSFMIDSHPIFFILSVILLIVVFGVVIALGNAFHDIFTNEITGQEAKFPFTFFIFNHLLPIFIVVGFSILVVMVAKPQ